MADTETKDDYQYSIDQIVADPRYAAASPEEKAMSVIRGGLLAREGVMGNSDFSELEQHLGYLDQQENDALSTALSADQSGQRTLADLTDLKSNFEEQRAATTDETEAQKLQQDFLQSRFKLLDEARKTRLKEKRTADEADFRVAADRYTTTLGKLAADEAVTRGVGDTFLQAIEFGDKDGTPGPGQQFRQQERAADMVKLYMDNDLSKPAEVADATDRLKIGLLGAVPDRNDPKFRDMYLLDFGTNKLDSVKLSSGRVLVNPKLLWNKSAWDAQVDSQHTTPAEAAAAKARRITLRDNAADVTREKLLSYSSFREFLHKETKGAHVTQYNSGDVIDKYMLTDHKSDDQWTKFMQRFEQQGRALYTQVEGLYGMTGLPGSEAAREAAMGDIEASAYIGEELELAGQSRGGRLVAGAMDVFMSVAPSILTGGAAKAAGLAGKAGMTALAASAAAQSAGGNFSQFYTTLRDQGLDDKQAHARAVVPALITGAITGVLTKVMSGGAEAAIIGGGAKVAGAGWKAAIKAGTKSGIQEIPEEAFDQLGSGLVEKSMIDPTRKFGDILWESLEAGGMGFFGGQALGTIHNIDEQRAQTKQRTGLSKELTESIQQTIAAINDTDDPAKLTLLAAKIGEYTKLAATLAAQGSPHSQAAAEKLVDIYTQKFSGLLGETVAAASAAEESDIAWGVRINEAGKREAVLDITGTPAEAEIRSALAALAKDTSLSEEERNKMKAGLEARLPAAAAASPLHEAGANKGLAAIKVTATQTGTSGQSGYTTFATEAAAASYIARQRAADPNVVITVAGINHAGLNAAGVAEAVARLNAAPAAPAASRRKQNDPMPTPEDFAKLDDAALDANISSVSKMVAAEAQDSPDAPFLRAALIALRAQKARRTAAPAAPPLLPPVAIPEEPQEVVAAREAGLTLSADGTVNIELPEDTSPADLEVFQKAVENHPGVSDAQKEAIVNAIKARQVAKREADSGGDPQFVQPISLEPSLQLQARAFAFAKRQAELDAVRVERAAARAKDQTRLADMTPEQRAAAEMLARQARPGVAFVDRRPINWVEPASTVVQDPSGARPPLHTYYTRNPARAEQMTDAELLSGKVDGQVSDAAVLQAITNGTPVSVDAMERFAQKTKKPEEYLPDGSAKTNGVPDGYTLQGHDPEKTDDENRKTALYVKQSVPKSAVAPAPGLKLPAAPITSATADGTDVADPAVIPPAAPDPALSEAVKVAKANFEVATAAAVAARAKATAAAAEAARIAGAAPEESDPAASTSAPTDFVIGQSEFEIGGKDFLFDGIITTSSGGKLNQWVDPTNSEIKRWTSVSDHATSSASPAPASGAFAELKAKANAAAAEAEVEAKKAEAAAKAAEAAVVAAEAAANVVPVAPPVVSEPSAAEVAAAAKAVAEAEAAAKAVAEAEAAAAVAEAAAEAAEAEAAAAAKAAADAAPPVLPPAPDAVTRKIQALVTKAVKRINYEKLRDNRVEEWKLQLSKSSSLNAEERAVAEHLRATYRLNTEVKGPKGAFAVAKEFAAPAESAVVGAISEQIDEYKLDPEFKRTAAVAYIRKLIAKGMIRPGKDGARLAEIEEELAIKGKDKNKSGRTILDLISESDLQDPNAIPPVAPARVAEIGRTSVDPQTGSVFVETTSNKDGKNYAFTAEVKKDKTRWYFSAEDVTTKGEYAGTKLLSSEKVRALAVTALGESFVSAVEAAHKDASDNGSDATDRAFEALESALATLKAPPIAPDPVVNEATKTAKAAKEKSEVAKAAAVAARAKATAAAAKAKAAAATAAAAAAAATKATTKVTTKAATKVTPPVVSDAAKAVADATKAVADLEVEHKLALFNIITLKALTQERDEKLEGLKKGMEKARTLTKKGTVKAGAGILTEMIKAGTVVLTKARHKAVHDAIGKLDEAKARESEVFKLIHDSELRVPGIPENLDDDLAKAKKVAKAAKAKLAGAQATLAKAQEDAQTTGEPLPDVPEDVLPAGQEPVELTLDQQEAFAELKRIANSNYAETAKRVEYVALMYEMLNKDLITDDQEREFNVLSDNPKTTASDLADALAGFVVRMEVKESGEIPDAKFINNVLGVVLISRGHSPNDLAFVPAQDTNEVSYTTVAFGTLKGASVVLTKIGPVKKGKKGKNSGHYFDPEGNDLGKIREEAIRKWVTAHIADLRTMVPTPRIAKLVRRSGLEKSLHIPVTDSRRLHEVRIERDNVGTEMEALRAKSPKSRGLKPLREKFNALNDLLRIKFLNDYYSLFPKGYYSFGEWMEDASKIGERVSEGGKERAVNADFITSRAAVLQQTSKLMVDTLFAVAAGMPLTAENSKAFREGALNALINPEDTAEREAELHQRLADALRSDVPSAIQMAKGALKRFLTPNIIKTGLDLGIETEGPNARENAQKFLAKFVPEGSPHPDSAQVLSFFTVTFSTFMSNWSSKVHLAQEVVLQIANKMYWSTLLFGDPTFTIIKKGDAKKGTVKGQLVRQKLRSALETRMGDVDEYQKLDTEGARIDLADKIAASDKTGSLGSDAAFTGNLFTNLDDAGKALQELSENVINYNSTEAELNAVLGASTTPADAYNASLFQVVKMLTTNPELLLDIKAQEEMGITRDELTTAGLQVLQRIIQTIAIRGLDTSVGEDASPHDAFVAPDFRIDRSQLSPNVVMLLRITTPATKSRVLTEDQQAAADRVVNLANPKTKYGTNFQETIRTLFVTVVEEAYANLKQRQAEQAASDSGIENTEDGSGERRISRGDGRAAGAEEPGAGLRKNADGKIIVGAEALLQQRRQQALASPTRVLENTLRTQESIRVGIDSVSEAFAGIAELQQWWSSPEGARHFTLTPSPNATPEELLTELIKARPDAVRKEFDTRIAEARARLKGRLNAAKAKYIDKGDYDGLQMVLDNFESTIELLPDTVEDKLEMLAAMPVALADALLSKRLATVVVASPTAPILVTDKTGITSHLTTKEKATAAEDLGHAKGWGAAAARSFRKAFADWLMTTKAASKRLITIFKRVAKASKAVVKALVAISFVSVSSSSVKSVTATIAPTETSPPSAMAFETPAESQMPPSTSLPPAPDFSLPASRPDTAVSPPSASAPTGATNFGSVATSVLDWIVQSNNNSGMPFAVADKQAGNISFYDKTGALVGRHPALFGKDAGDVLTKEGKITPAGRFPVTFSQDPEGYLGTTADLTPTKRGSIIALHQLYLKKPKELRAERLLSASPADNRISWGCINVDASLMDNTVIPHFKEGGFVYILPETAAGKKAFAKLDTDGRMLPSFGGLLNSNAIIAATEALRTGDTVAARDMLSAELEEHIQNTERELGLHPGVSLLTVLENVAEGQRAYRPTAAVAALARAMAEANPQLASVPVISDWTLTALGVIGAHTPAGVKLNPLMASAEAGATAAHEAGHALTRRVLDLYAHSPEQLSPAQQAACQNLHALYQEALGKVATHPNFAGVLAGTLSWDRFISGIPATEVDHIRRTHYGLQNVHEFVTELLTNSGFQTVMNSIDSEVSLTEVPGEKKSIWQRVKDALRTMWFNGRKLNEGSILSRAFDQSVNLIETVSGTLAETGAQVSDQHGARQIDADRSAAEVAGFVATNRIPRAVQITLRGVGSNTGDQMHFIVLKNVNAGGLHPVTGTRERDYRVSILLNDDPLKHDSYASMADALRAAKAQAQLGTQNEWVEVQPNVVKYSFAGMSAKLPKLMSTSFETAQAMAAAGKTSEKIRAVTGWFPGKYDGMMRFEVPDGKAEMTSVWEEMREGPYWEVQIPVRLGDVLIHPKLFDAYPELADVGVTKRKTPTDGTGRSSRYGDIQGWFEEDNNIINIVPENWEPLSSLLHEIQHWIQSKEGFALGGDTESVMGNITPGQKTVVLRQLEEEAADRRRANEQEVVTLDEILEIAARTDGPAFDRAAAAQREVEKEHRIARTEISRRSSGRTRKQQELEMGFAKWGYAKAQNKARRSMLKAAGLDVRNKAAFARWGIYWRVGHAESLRSLIASATKDRKELIQEMAHHEAAITEARQSSEGFKAAIDLFDLSNDIYRSIAGEIESRDVQDRADMTPKQRKATEPYSTQNIASEDALVMFDRDSAGDGATSYSMLERGTEQSTPAPGFTRLWRAELGPADGPLPDWAEGQEEMSGTEDASGRWFYGTKQEAEYHNATFGGSGLSYVDVPTSEAESFNAKDNPHAGGYGRDGKEYFIPREYAEKRQRVSNTAGEFYSHASVNTQAEKLQGLLSHFNDAADRVLERTSYGVRTEKTTTNSFVLQWSNSAKQWGVARGGQFISDFSPFPMSDNDGAARQAWRDKHGRERDQVRVKAGHEVRLDADYILVPAATQQEAVDIARHLPELPLDKFSHESNPVIGAFGRLSPNDAIFKELGIDTSEFFKQPDKGAAMDRYMDFLSEKTKEIRFADDQTQPGEFLYHVTNTDVVPKLRAQGIRPMQTSNWTVGATGKRYGNGEVYAFESPHDAAVWAGKMDWSNNKDIGSGKISIIRIRKSEGWVEDPGSPLEKAGAKGRWLKKMAAIAPDEIVDSAPFTPDVTKNMTSGKTVSAEDLFPGSQAAGDGATLYSKSKQTVRSIAFQKVQKALLGEVDESQRKRFPSSMPEDFDAAAAWLNTRYKLQTRQDLDTLMFDLTQARPEGLNLRTHAIAKTIVADALMKAAPALMADDPELAQVFRETAKDLTNELKDEASMAGSHLQVFAGLTRAYTPDSATAEHYTDPVTGEQKPGINGNPVAYADLQKVQAAQDKARKKAAALSAKAITKAFLKLYPGHEKTLAHFFTALGEAATPAEKKTAAEDLEIAVLQSVIMAVREASNLELAPDSKLLEGVKKQVKDQLTTLFDSAAAPLNEGEKTLRAMDVIKSWFVNSEMSKSLFDKARDAIVANKDNFPTEMAEAIEKLRTAEFSPVNSSSLATAVLRLLPMQSMLVQSLADRNTSITSAIRHIQREFPEITDSLVESLREMLTAVFDTKLAEHTRIEIGKLKDAKGQPVLEESAVTRLVRYMNGGVLDDEAAYNVLAEKYALPVWSMETVAWMRKEFERVLTIPEGNPRNYAEQKLLTELAKRHWKETGAKGRFAHTRDLLNSLWVAGVLSGPTTQLVNAGWTAANVFSELMYMANAQYNVAVKGGASKDAARQFYVDAFKAYKFAIGSGAETGVSRFTGSAAVSEFLGALTTGGTRFSSESKEVMSELEQYSFSMPTSNPLAFPGWVKDQYLAMNKMVGRVMLASDAFNRVVARSGYAIMHARAEALADGRDDLTVTEDIAKLYDPDRARLDRIQETVAREGFTGLDARRRYHELLERELFGTTALRHAENFAQRATFNNDAEGIVGFLMMNIFGTLNQIPILGKAINPFPRMLSNMINLALDYTMYGYLRANDIRVSNMLRKGTLGAKFTPPMVNDGTKEGALRYHQIVARAHTGTAVLTLLFSLILAGLGDDDDDRTIDLYGTGPLELEKARQVKDARAGRNASTIKIGPLRINYQDIPGVGMWIGAMASVRDFFRYDKKASALSDTDRLEIVKILAFRSINAVLDRNMLSGVNNAVKIGEKNPSGQERGFMRFAKSAVEGITKPAILRWLSDTVSAKEAGFDVDHGFAGWMMSRFPLYLDLNGKQAFNSLGETIDDEWYVPTTRRFGDLPDAREPHPVLAPLIKHKLFVPVPQAVVKLPDKTELAMSSPFSYEYRMAFAKKVGALMTPARVADIASRLDAISDPKARAEATKQEQDIITNTVGPAARMDAFSTLVELRKSNSK